MVLLSNCSSIRPTDEEYVELPGTGETAVYVPKSQADAMTGGRLLRLKKFFKEQTLLNQAFIKDTKKTVSKYLEEIDLDLSITTFKRVSL